MRKPLNYIKGFLIGNLLGSPALLPTLQEKTQKSHIDFSQQPISCSCGLEDIATQERPSYKTSNFTQDSDEVLLARMLYGETRNCSDFEKIAIAYTAINRVKDKKTWNGETLREVILSRNQYSCFNESDENRKKLMNPEADEPEAFYHSLELAKDVLAGKYKDPTNRATHYHHPSVNPFWATEQKIRSGQVTRLGKLKSPKGKQTKNLFYREN